MHSSHGQWQYINVHSTFDLVLGGATSLVWPDSTLTEKSPTIAAAQEETIIVYSGISTMQ